MLENLHQMYKKNPVWAYVVLFLSGAILILIPKVLFFSSQSPAEASESFSRIKLLFPFLIGCGIGIMFLSKTIRSKLFSKKSEPNISECLTKSKSLSVEEKNVESKTHQQILDEMGEYLWALKKYKFWTIGCLVVAWIIVFIGRWFDIGSHNPAAFTTAVFLFALLVGTKDLEKESEADANVVKCVLQGLRFEKRLNSKSNYLQSFAKRYEGFGMFLFMFIRISPTLMIVFSLFNAGLAHLLVAYLSPLVMYGGMGVGLGLIGLFLGNVACGPYRQLLMQLKGRCS